MNDFTDAIEDPETMPLCPFCDQPIMDYEPAAVIAAHGVRALAHSCCVEEASD